MFFTEAKFGKKRVKTENKQQYNIKDKNKVNKRQNTTMHKYMSIDVYIIYLRSLDDDISLS